MPRLLPFALALAALLPRPAPAFNIGGERWATSPVRMELQLGPTPGTLIDGSASWNAVANDALSAWNNSLAGFRFAGVLDSTAAQARSNRINNVFFSSTVYGESFGSRTLAITLSRFTGTSLIETDVLFNSNLSWNSYRGATRTSAGTTVYDFRRIALHEFGHALGLDHPDDIGQSVSAIMNSTIGNLDSLAADDIAGARAIYDPGLTAPAITTQPVARTVALGQSATFTVVATGTAPLAYQWRKDSVALSGATAVSLTLGVVTANDAGNYTAVVTNAAGSATSSAALLTVTAPGNPPTISTQPFARSVLAGQSVSFSVTATGTAPLSYQWLRNGATPIPGATAATFALSAATLADAGSYAVIVSNSSGSVTSTAVTLAVTSLPAPPVVSTAPVSRTVVAGQSAAFSVVATGTSPLAFQWRKDGVALPGATASTLTLVNVTAANAGAYTVAITNSVGTTVSAAATLTVEPASRLGNVAVLAALAPRQTLTIGFTMSGGPKPVLVRAVGPGLSLLNVAGPMPDPALTLFQAGAGRLVTVDDWVPTADVSAAAAAVGAFPLPASGSLDAALLRPVTGGHTVEVTGSPFALDPNTNGGSVLVEVYDAGTGTSARLTNLSALQAVGTGADILIAGFTLTGSGKKRLLIRAVGPRLAAAPFDIAGMLLDPRLELFTATTPPVRIGQNDNWANALAPAFISVGAFILESGSRDAALVVELDASPSGTGYTVQVSGVGGTTGLALVELYELP